MLKNRIKELRKAQGLTLEQLAAATEASNQHISHLENGRRRLSLDWMERIGKALRCSPLALIDDPSIATTIEETNLLTVFRMLSEVQREAFVVAASSIIAPEATLESRKV